MKSWFLLLLLCLSPLNSVLAAAFNCDNAAAPNEHLICDNRELSVLDEVYSDRYWSLISAVQDEDAVKADARFALKERDRQCDDVACLSNWYTHRIALLDLAMNRSLNQSYYGKGKLFPKPDFTIQKHPHPVTLFRALNLRSFKNPLTEQLGMSCGSYLSDYIDPEHIQKVTNSRYPEAATYHFGKGYPNFSITVHNHQVVDFYGSAVRGKSSSGRVEIRHSAEHNEWRGSEEFVAKPDVCLERSNEEWKALAIPAKLGNLMAVERFSVGEFPLEALPSNQVGPSRASSSQQLPDNPYHVSETPVYNRIGGTVIGNLNLSVYLDPHEGSYVRVSIANEAGERIATTQVFPRAKYYPALMVFGKDDGWYQVNKGDDEDAVWIHEKTTHPAIIKTFVSRTELLKRADEVKVHSNHRLRSAPTLNADILRVLEPSIGLLVPQEIQGDWVKVVYVNPHPGTADIDETMLEEFGDDYDTDVGWLKWRNSPTEQFIDMEHHIGM